MNIIRSSSYMKSNISKTSLLETECLFGESIEILKEDLDWVFCRLITDNYCGWVKKNDIGRLKRVTHRVINIRTFFFKEPNEKSDIITYLPMGSLLTIETIQSDWAKTYFFFGEEIQIGYVPSQHIVNIRHKVFDWVATAQQLEGIPYRWGGRNTIGIDCSAFLQLSYQTYGESIPRNTSEQVKLKKPELYQIDDLSRGCVVFWEGHVGIMIDKLNCIHANAFHMRIVTEPLIDIIKRMSKDNKILKMMDFN